MRDLATDSGGTTGEADAEASMIDGLLADLGLGTSTDSATTDDTTADGTITDGTTTDGTAADDSVYDGLGTGGEAITQ